MSYPMESWPQRHRITVDQYHRMGETGVLAPDARVELIEGEIIDMAPIGADHGSVVDQLTSLLVKAVGERAVVRVQGAVRLDQRSEPQPDVALLRPRADRYRGHQPLPQDLLLLVEVSDTTLRYDRDLKVPLYARHAIPEVWLFDLQQAHLLRYRSPEGGQYRLGDVLPEPGRLELAALPGVEVDLSGVLEGPG